MKLTITIDTDLHKVAPISATEEMCAAGANKLLSLVDDGTSSWADDFGMAYGSAIAALPDTPSGVAVHSGAPVVAQCRNPEDGPWMELSLVGYDEAVAYGYEVRKLFPHPPAQPDTELKARIVEDGFNGDNAKLCECIDALLKLDATGSLVPHGVGGHARTMLAAAVLRIQALKAEIADADAAMRVQTDRLIAAQAGQEPCNAWQDISTLPYADDLVWLKHGDSIEGPRPMRTDDCDQYSEWAPCTWPRDNASPPAPANALAIVQAALEAAAKSTTEYEFTFVGREMAKTIRAILPQTIIDAASSYTCTIDEDDL